jgi:4-alpha-glucanotransferase
MKLTFNLEYQTTFGEELVLNILTKHYKMSTIDGLHWSCQLTLGPKDGACIDYYYTVMRGDEELRHEWLVEPHRLELAASKGVRYTVYDHWLDIPEDSYMYSSAFTDCVAARKCNMSLPTSFSRTVRLKVRASQLRGNERLAVLGNTEALGNWEALAAQPMTEHNNNEWVLSLDADVLPRTFEFKFVVLDEEKDVTPLWEDGMNRTISLPDIEEGEVVVYELSQAWFPVYPWKGAGTVIPVFSLRSEGSFGVGDFGDLKLMIDWCDKTRQRILQVLPINDTTNTHTWQDSYPYNAISIYALHPQFCDFRQMPALKDENLRTQFEQLRQELNALPQIDYERVYKAKMDYLRLLFQQEWTAVSRRESYKQFFEQNKEWLVPYAAFSYYRDLYGTSEFGKWPKEATPDIQHPSPSAKKELNFWYYVQYNLDKQMHEAHNYARQHRIILKGDIPIGISRDGVEAWVEPKYFNLNGQAGAPPDPFSADGQNWGFPTYNWDEMLKDGCQWWVRRFRKMAQYFDAYRIDHVLGFFRIWEIPVPEKSGLMGQFSPALGLSREEIEAYGIVGHEDLFLVDHKRADRWHPRIAVQYQEAYKKLTEEEKDNFNRLYNDYFYHRNNHYWYTEAMKKLPRLTQATRMLVCAEDLGMVPDCVPWVMNELRILSLEIQSMPKNPQVRFGHLSQYPYRSVCTISTHDMPTLRQWWDEDAAQTQEYFTTMLYRGGEAPHPLPGWLAKDIVSRHLTSPSMLCLLSLQDWLSIDERLRLPDQNAERINIPANPRHYWRYRMHLTIEQLLEADDFNKEIQTLIVQSGRK